MANRPTPTTQNCYYPNLFFFKTVLRRPTIRTEDVDGKSNDQVRSNLIVPDVDAIGRGRDDGHPDQGPSVLSRFLPRNQESGTPSTILSYLLHRNPANPAVFTIS